MQKRTHVPIKGHTRPWCWSRTWSRDCHQGQGHHQRTRRKALRGLSFLGRITWTNKWTYPTRNACARKIGTGTRSAPPDHLEQTTHRNSALGKGEVAKKQSEAARKKLLSSAYLPGRRAPLLDGEDDHELNRLGGVPFMQVQAGGSAPRWSQLKTQ